MRDAVLSFLQAQGVTPGARVVVGLSGGADSVCLLHLLASLRDVLPAALSAVHIEHGIRGEESRKDAAFCQVFCASLGVPLAVRSVDVPAVCRQTGEGHEACGRRLRYAAFEDAAGEAGFILTAHTADDNAETVLLHLVRGTGLRGLCGIPPVRGRILRPLLSFSRADVEAYCAKHGLSYRVDSTNADPRYLRNRMRREVLPVFKTMNPAALAAFSRMTADLRADEAYLEAQTGAAAKETVAPDGIREEAFLALPAALRRRVAQRWLAEALGVVPEHKWVDALCALAKTGKSVTLFGSTVVRSRAGRLELVGAPAAAWAVEFPVPRAPVCVQTPAGPVRLTPLVQKDLQNLHKADLANVVDCATMDTNLVLRSRRAGDRFCDPRRGVTKELRKWFNEKKLAPERRGAVPVLACGDRLLWVGGFGADAFAKAGAETAHGLLVEAGEKSHASDDEIAAGCARSVF